MYDEDLVMCIFPSTVDRLSPDVSDIVLMSLADHVIICSHIAFELGIYYDFSSSIRFINLLKITLKMCTM